MLTICAGRTTSVEAAGSKAWKARARELAFLVEEGCSRLLRILRGALMHASRISARSVPRAANRVVAFLGTLCNSEIGSLAFFVALILFTFLI